VKQSERLRRAGDSSQLYTRFAAALNRCRSCNNPDPHSVIDHIVDALHGWPGAQAFEQDRSSGHTVTVDEDSRARPMVSDPTGEAAILHDRAAHDLREVDKRIRRIARDVETLVAVAALYTPHSATTRQRTATARFNDPGCTSCARLPSPADPKVPRYEPPHTRTGVYVAGKAWLLCWWCRRWVKDTGRIPTKEELAAHHRGETVRRPA
jgi:hypothetical protein